MTRTSMWMAMAACLGLLGTAPAQTVLQFDFSASSGDRNASFGTDEPSGTFNDGNSTSAGFYVTGSTFHGNATGAAIWAVADDSQPTTSNGSIPAGQASLEASSLSTLSLRTYLTTNTSSASGVASYAGFAFGLSNSSSTASGFLAVVEDIPGGGGTGQLFIYALTNGVRSATAIASSPTFTYGSSSSAYFLSLTVNASGAFAFDVLSDASVTGSGSGTSRLTDPSFTSATPVAAATGTLSGYMSGWTGLYFESAGTAAGAVSYGNYYASFTAVPEPGTEALGGAAILLLGGGALRRRLAPRQ